MDDLHALVKLSADVVKLGWHRHIFGSQGKFSPWKEAFKGAKEALRTEGSKGAVQANEENVAEMESKSLMHIKGKRNYTRNTTRVCINNVNMMEHAPHFWRFGLSKSEQQNTCDNQTLPSYGSGIAVKYECSVGTPRMSFADTVFDLEKAPGKSDRRAFLRHEKMQIALTRLVVRMFTRHGGMVLDPCVETLVAAKACLIEHRHCKCMGCDVDSNCVIKMMLSLLTVFTQQVVNDKSHIVGSKEV